MLIAPPGRETRPQAVCMCLSRGIHRTYGVQTQCQMCNSLDTQAHRRGRAEAREASITASATWGHSE
jgi:hypothetical protein